MKGPVPGTKVNITIEGKTYETYIDDDGTQRFPEVPGLHGLRWTDTGRFRGQNGPRHARPVSLEVAELAKTNTAVAWLVENQPTDLNMMSVAFQEGAFTRIDYAEFNMHIGYSVSGWSMSFFFEYDMIWNPLWVHPVEALAVTWDEEKGAEG